MSHMTHSDLPERYYVGVVLDSYCTVLFFIFD